MFSKIGRPQPLKITNTTNCLENLLCLCDISSFKTLNDSISQILRVHGKYTVSLSPVVQSPSVAKLIISRSEFPEIISLTR